MATTRYAKDGQLYLTNMEIRNFKQDGKGFLKNIWNGFIDSMMEDHGVGMFMEGIPPDSKLKLIMIDKKHEDIVREQVEHCIKHCQYKIHMEINNMAADTITLAYNDAAVYATRQCPKSVS